MREKIDIDTALRLLNDPLDPLYFSDSYKRKILAFEARKRQIYVMQETWRLKNKATWLAGDINTRFFHNHATCRRKENAIWGIQDDDGNYISIQADIEQVTVRHFNAQFKQKEQNFTKQMEFISLMPCMFADDDMNSLGD